MRTRRVKLQCCGYKRCPTATLHADGSLVLVDTDDGKDERIELAAEQVDTLRALLGGALTVPRRGRIAR